MKQQIITLVNQRIHELFNESKNILLQQDSYHQEVDTQHLFQYFSFLETALQQPYNRLMALRAFLKDDADYLLSDLMYPLAMLREEAINAIDDNSTQAAKFVNGLDVADIAPEMDPFCVEQFKTSDSTN